MSRVWYGAILAVLYCSSPDKSPLEVNRIFIADIEARNAADISNGSHMGLLKALMRSNYRLGQNLKCAFMPCSCSGKPAWCFYREVRRTKSRLRHKDVGLIGACFRPAYRFIDCGEETFIDFAARVSGHENGAENFMPILYLLFIIASQEKYHFTPDNKVYLIERTR